MTRNRLIPARARVAAVVLLAVGLAAGGPVPEAGLPVPECGLPGQPEFRDARPARPTLSGSVSYRTKTHIRVHYTTSGSDATTLAYAESVAVFAESCWARGAAKGWINPPGDYGAGGSDLFDIYCRHSSNLGAYGVCVPDTVNTTYYPDGYCTWVEVCVDSVPQPFTRYGRLKALVAHEFHHAVQIAYTNFESPKWAFYENTSVWVEEVLWPGNGTLYWRNSRTTTYDENPLTYPYYSTISTTSTYEYPGGLWPLFLTEYFSSTNVREMWERCGTNSGSHMLTDINYVLDRDFSMDLYTAYGHYAIWRYFTGTRDDGLHFGRADECTTSFALRSHSTYPANGNEGTWDPYGPGGMDMISFTTNGSQDLTITFDGQNRYVWRAYVICKRGSTTYEQRMILDANYDGSITIPSWMVTTAVLVPVVVHWTDDMSETPALTFSYTASVADAPTGLAGEGLTRPVLGVLGGNPVRGPITVRYVLPEACEGTLTLTDASGRLVSEARLVGTGRQGVHTFARDAMPAGVYFCQLAAGGDALKHKLVLK